MNKDFDLLHVHIVGFSGQQTLRNPTAVAAELRRQLEKMHTPSRKLMALCPLTGATDLLFAKVALDLAIPLVVLLALPREDSRKAFPEAAAVEFDRVLEKAVKTEVLLLAPQLDAATRIGQKLVDETDVLLAVSDDAESSSEGDTLEVIAYATRRGRPVIRLQETGDGIDIRSIKSEKDLDRPQLSIEQLEKLLGEPPARPELPEGLVKYFHTCDTKATRTAPKVRRYVLDIVLLNALASISGSVSSSFNHSAAIGTTLTIIKFGAIFLSLAIFAVLRHRQSRNHWLTLRLKAEVCRSAMATWYSPSAIEPLTSDEIPELRQLLQALRYFRATRPRVPNEITVDGFKASYGVNRLIDQHHYFQRQAHSADVMSSRLTPFYWVLSGSALVLSGIGLFLPPHIWPLTVPGHLLNYLFIMVPIVAPALASWIISWQAIEAVSRKKARFVEMERLMHQALVDLIHCHSWETVQHVVKRAERQLLNEVLEWYAFVKYS